MKSVLQDAFEAYVLALRQTPLDQHTEMTGRGALETLLNRFKPARATVTHEPKRAQAKGAPDFKVAEAGQVLGYVENKAVGENLDAVLKSEQIKKYQTLSGNIVLTDYLRWIWLKDGRVIADCRLGEAGLLEDRKAQLRPEPIGEVQSLLAGFFSQPVAGISSAKPLAEALAVRSQLLRDFLGAELARQKEAEEGGQLIGLFGAFQKQVSHEITLAEFADAFAQTLAYGLFLAKFNDAPNKEITLANAKTFIPQSVGLIRELVGFLDNLDKPEYADIAWVVEEVLSIINGIKLAELQVDLSFRNRRARRGTRAGSEEEWRLFSRDPFIYFYEDYLAKYDSKLRKSRGVYYTPPPVVNFIVRAIHDILKDSFGIATGLADRNRVTVLDFACGTGTFLVEVLERIFEEIGADSGKAKQIVSDHILKNIFGFEYLIAPYTIAHLKLGQYLADKGHKLSDNERLQVLLTNTLEPIEAEPNYLVPELSRETAQAQAVKDKPILVITGNPPYARFSKNPSTRTVTQLVTETVRRGKTIKLKKPRYRKVKVRTRIGALIEDYKIVDGKHFNERKHWLDDDYVKFIRHAQAQVESQPEAVIGIITNHGYLDNPTFRGMRQSLLNSFDQIHVVNLHGNSRKKEQSPDGSADKNVFDIAQGVAIALLVKRPDIPKLVTYQDVWGSRQHKYEYLAGAVFNPQTSTRLSPASPFYFLTAHQPADLTAWLEHWSLDDIFGFKSAGALTGSDNFVVRFSPAEAIDDAKRFVGIDVEAARAEFRLGKDSRDWKASKAHAEAKALLARNSEPVAWQYRVFDVRYSLFSGQPRGLFSQPAGPLARAMALEGNIALVTTNRVEVGDFKHAIVTDRLPDGHSLSSKETNQAIPLYVPEGGLFDRRFNYSPKFSRWASSRFGSDWEKAVFGYIYAILNSDEFRRRFADYLLIDFPRIPFPEEREDFEALAALGWQLIQAHLMKAVPKRVLGAYRGKGNDRIEKLRYSPAERALWINDTNCFADIPQPVWDFTIGSYQVIDKYLKSRKGRTLSLDEIENVENVINILDYTIEQMRKIDERYCAAFENGSAHAN